MITEIAYLTIDPARAADFEIVVRQAAPLFESADGCHGMRLAHVVEDPAEYRLFVLWETVDHHMVLFRGSEGFRQWRELAGPFFVVPPKIEHWQTSDVYFPVPL